MKDKKLIMCFMGMFVFFAIIWGAEINKRNKQIYELTKEVRQLSKTAEGTLEEHDNDIYHLFRDTNAISAREKEIAAKQLEQEADLQKQIDDLNDRIDKLPGAAETETQMVPEAEATEEMRETIVSGAVRVVDENGNTVSEYGEEVVTEKPVTKPAGGLTAAGGIYWFGDQLETYYNLDMSVVVSVARNKGIDGEYWIREDGCKMLGNYIMVAASYSVHPYGSLVETSLGTGIVVDTGGFAAGNPKQIDIATNW